MTPEDESRLAEIKARGLAACEPMGWLISKLKEEAEENKKLRALWGKIEPYQRRPNGDRCCIQCGRTRSMGHGEFCVFAEAAALTDDTTGKDSPR